MSDEGYSSLFERLERLGVAGGKNLPPVERWHPERQGSSAMRIDVDGRWFYQGSEIQRPPMVRLFSTVLRRDPDGYFLVTPAERLSIEVEDAPFVAVSVDRRGSGEQQDIVFETHVGDLVVADATHRIQVRGEADAPRPYVEVRRGLEARIARSVYYELVNMAVERSMGDRPVLGLWSGGVFHVLGETRPG